jgi:DNA-binding response OmpR family regulator
VAEHELETGQQLMHALDAAGFQPFWVADGNQALTLVAKTQPDLLILEWLLPKVDGLQVLRRLRATYRGDLPVLLLAERGEDLDRVVGLDGGADGYLVKPFCMDELVAYVRAMLRRGERLRGILQRAEQAPVALRYGALTVDAHYHTVRMLDKVLELTRMEFKLLTLLMGSPGCIFSRVDLQKLIWNQCYVSGDRTVDNMVLRLRRKLGNYGDHIETIWGVGYRLRVL